MAKLTEFDDELTRGRVAREEFIKGYCSWWPATYVAHMPVTFRGEELLAAKGAIERMIAADHAQIAAEQQNPWTTHEPKSQMIDWTDANPLDVMAAATRLQPGPGVARPVKFGKGIDPADGELKSYRDFDEVKRAVAAAVGTKAYKRDMKFIRQADALEDGDDDDLEPNMKIARDGEEGGDN